MSEQKTDLLESETDILGQLGPACWLADLEETLLSNPDCLQVSAHKRLIISPSGSLLVVYSRRDLVRMHKAKSRAILKAEKTSRAALDASHASGT